MVLLMKSVGGAVNYTSTSKIVRSRIAKGKALELLMAHPAAKSG
jgi:hypothetical protein